MQGCMHNNCLQKFHVYILARRKRVIRLRYNSPATPVPDMIRGGAGLNMLYTHHFNERLHGIE